MVLTANELRSMRRAICGRINRALSFSASWIGCRRLKRVGPSAESITGTRRFLVSLRGGVAVVIRNFQRCRGVSVVTVRASGAAADAGLERNRLRQILETSTVSKPCPALRFASLVSAEIRCTAFDTNTWNTTGLHPLPGRQAPEGNPL